MKSVLLLITIAFSLNIFAKRLVLCENSNSMPSQAQIDHCSKQLFYTSHVDTYYGASAYMSDGKVGADKLISLLRRLKKEFQGHDDSGSGPNYFVTDDFLGEISKAEKIMLVIEEHDMPMYHVYTLSTDRRDIPKKVSMFYADGFYEPRNLEANDFGFSISDEILGYIF